MGQLAAVERDWGELGLDASLVSHLTTAGYPGPTALQQQLLPAITNERDVIMEAPTGAGRTLAIGVAITELVGECDPGDTAVALIISSSDQRCSAIAHAVHQCGSAIQRSGQSGIRTAIVSELGAPHTQAEALAKPLDVIIGTPQRLNQLATTEQLTIDTLEMIVVDDADDLAVGDHSPALATLLDSVEADRQRVVLTGALLPPLTDLFDSRLTDPQRPQLPATEPRRNALPQQAFVAADPTPDRVASLALTLGAPVVALVPVRQLEKFEKFIAQSTAPMTVATLEEPGPLPTGAAIVCTRLPTWTDDYAAIVSAATAAGCAEVVLLTTPANRQLLRAHGKAGGVHLNAAPFPTEHAVETRQIMKLEELVTDQLARVSSQPTPKFLASVHRLSAEYDVADIAAAAMELAHQALQREIEPGEDIPLLLRQKSANRSADRRQVTPVPDTSAQRRTGGDRRGKEVEAGMIRLFVAAGYNYGVRPGDIVGAFAGESGLSGKEIGNIDIRESFTLVEVPEKFADDVIDAMQTGTIKGRQIEVRRERY